MLVNIFVVLFQSLNTLVYKQRINANPCAGDWSVAKMKMEGKGGSKDVGSRRFRKIGCRSVSE